MGALAVPTFDVLTKLKLASAPPTEVPLVGKRWAMVIDLKACLAKDGCKDCIDACHHIHNVPAYDNVKDEIKWIWTAPYGKVFPEKENKYIESDSQDRPALILCNHCDNPPCIKVCPTRATWRREDGIVMMDYHRCIGCRYCMAACPYGARSFNWRDPRPFIDEINPDFPTRMRGVVEKCNFCEERLAEGLIPACVEACQEKGLFFGDLQDPNSQIREILQSRHVTQRLPELGTNPNVYYVE